MRRRATAVAGGLIGTMAFVLLATLNSAGYRYGASDQAFYGPAIIRGIDPGLYPRDGGLIEAQAHLTLADETVAPLVRVTGGSVPLLFLLLYVLSLALLAIGVWRVGRILYASRWSVVALLAAVTLRHAIAESGTNTLEGYFHPRQVAFALGVLGLGSFLGGRPATAAVLVLLGGLVHPTTALWLAVWLGIAMVVTYPRLRRQVPPLSAAAVATIGWAVVAGPLHGRFGRMDTEWLATLAEKDYLFPLQWPAWVWLANLGYVAVILWGYRQRAAMGALRPRERGLVIGCLALVPVFLATLPFNAARVQLAIQLQPARIFWMVDLLATIYVVWLLAESGRRAGRPRLVAAVLVAVSLGRGLYIRFVEFPARPTFEVGVKDDDWGRVMAWMRTSPRDSFVLADPQHALRYGTSVRVAGERDVFVEASKDAALGMYDRAVAMRTRDRVAAVGDFGAITSEHAQALAARYGLDYLVSDGELELPVAFASGALRVYRLGPTPDRDPGSGVRNPRPMALRKDRAEGRAVREAAGSRARDPD